MPSLEINAPVNADAQETDENPPIFAIAVRILVASMLLLTCCCIAFLILCYKHNTRKFEEKHVRANVKTAMLWIKLDSDKASIAGGDILSYGGFSRWLP